MLKIAICGITGAVGQEILNCLKALDFSIDELTCFASEQSAGKIINTPFGRKIILAFDKEICRDYDFVFLCISGSFSAQYGKTLAEQNRCVIDNSSHFRYDEDIPLVLPEINGHLVRNAKLIANPNCTTAILAVALHPIYKNFGLRKVILSTYQAASGGGKEAMEELKTQTANYLANKEVASVKFTHPIPFNIIPAIGVFLENGYTEEEMKVVWELQKIFDDSSIKISTTAVRIPIFRAHSHSVTIETEKPIDIKKIRTILDNVNGIDLIDLPQLNEYPMPLTASNKHNVEVGRIRPNKVFDEYGLDIFISGDQLLKGAALNAVQIARYTLGL